MNSKLALSKLFQIDRRTLGIEWGDGVRQSLSVREMRLACPCATCVHEWTGEKIVRESAIAEDVHPVNIERVGHYGLRIQWSDGHATGIYTFQHLRSLGAPME